MSAHGTCDYCGLPLGAVEPTPAMGGDAPSDRLSDGGELEKRSTAQYCCYGCQFAAGVAGASGDAAQARWLMTRLGLSVFFTMNVMVFTLVLWSHPGGAADDAAEVYHGVARYLCLLFATPVMLMLAGPIVAAAVEEVRRWRPSLHLVLAAGVFAAYGYSVVSVLRGGGHVYFEVSCMVLVFVTLGRWFEASGKLRTTAALRALEQLLPERVRVEREGEWVEAPRESVTPGERVRVIAGERIPVDGVVERSRGSVDEQVVTGESLPVVKEAGDAVHAGTLNLDGDLRIIATSRADAGLVARLIESVTRATTEREPYQRLAARLSRRFVPIVATIAVATFAWHFARGGFEPAVLASLSVVVIACPCALGLATPMALWAALGRAAQARVLLQEGDALSRLAEADAIFFDKTGTLSTGQATLREWRVATGDSQTEVERVACQLASAARHPLGQALLDAQRSARGSDSPLSSDSLDSLEATDGATESRTLAGRGVEGIPTGMSTLAWLGSRRLMDEQGQSFARLRLDDVPSEVLAASPQCFVAWGGEVRGAALFDEQFRDAAPATLAWFGQREWLVAVLTGDRRERAARLARDWNTTVEAELLPDDKLAAIRVARAAGRKVVMVGDGINDAPALAAADVGVALGCGADVSRQSAAVCLLGNDLRTLPWLVTLAKLTASAVRWNLVWAFGYNIVGIAIAACGWMNPIFAAIAMVASSVMVVSNSLRLAHLPLPGEAFASEHDQVVASGESSADATESPGHERNSPSGGPHWAGASP